MPPTWNIGTAVRISSSAVIPKAAIEFSAFAVSAPCVSTAPFGAPLVPDVYAIRTGVAGSRSGSAATAIASPTCRSSPSASKTTTPVGASATAEELRAVRAEIRDAVARLDPRLRQKAGHPSDSGARARHRWSSAPRSEAQSWPASSSPSRRSTTRCSRRSDRAVARAYRKDKRGPHYVVAAPSVGPARVRPCRFVLTTDGRLRGERTDAMSCAHPGAC